jgi:hypothetical protein
VLRLRIGRWVFVLVEPCCTNVSRINGPTAAENDLEGGTEAGPKRFFQFLADVANQNSSSQGHPRLHTSPIEMVDGRLSIEGN